MIKKITDKDKEDWESFLNNKEKIPNKNPVKKKDIKNPDKDKQDWENFLNNKEKIPNKDFVHKKNIRYEKIKKIDLHGYTIEEANKAVEQFIQKCFDEDVTKIIVITGKGLRSKNVENPYLSKDLSILKYSVPEFIENNKSLKKFIIEITDAKIEDGGSGAFYIYLKNKNKFK
ncbi:Smr/MutS family protein [Candidatus Pelagibacter sp.]|nr:Smr/MutS family protein [Candidatus Pelagibacter sp.]